MKKLLAFPLLLIFGIAVAQSTIGPITTNKPVVCETTSLVLDYLANGEYKELPVWAGKDEKTSFGLLVNQATGTWTLIEFNKDHACLLGSGINSRAIHFGKSSTPL